MIESSDGDYNAWLEARRYAVICNHRIGHRLVDRVIAKGLQLKEARELEQTMRARETAAKPLRTSWTGRLFNIQLETPPWPRAAAYVRPT